MDFKISNFTCVFSQKWVTEGSNPGVALFSKLLLSGSLSIPHTTGESPNGMGGNVLDLVASGHLLDYVIDNLLMCLGLLRHYLGTNCEHSSSGQAQSVSAWEHCGTNLVESKL